MDIVTLKKININNPVFKNIEKQKPVIPLLSLNKDEHNLY